jgi:predicted nucleic acid-binding protein
LIGIDTTFLIDLEILDSPRHKKAVKLFEKWQKEKHSVIAIFNQSFLEFQHVITDSRRFNNPLSMEQALERTWFWVDQERIKIIYPNENSLKRALLWTNMYKLGRNRIQDTHMAAAFAESGVTELWTANPSDFEIFEVFDLIDYK